MRIIWLRLLLITLLVSACGPAIRYQVKTFFFTGVPEPGKEQIEVGSTGIDTPPVTINTSSKRKIYPSVQHFTHGPFAAGQCERCHATLASKPFRTGKDTAFDVAVDQDVSIGARLAFSQKELCVGCHSEKSATAAEAEGLWLHGPVARGWCTLCHSPHKASRQYMLKQTTIELCTQCHTVPDLQITLEHQRNPDVDCVSCHNPHMGKSATLLKAEYDEWQRFN